MVRSIEKLPKHLRKYVVEQNYDRYTPEDQAVWRYIMRQLKMFLSEHAHPCYVEGLRKTGISVEEIPRIEEMDKKLSEFGWGALPVSGFIPPAAFMEFQSLGILPIASDMRTVDHLLYTPAPDIVHEAAGHAPILIDPDFAEYLKRYAQVASHAIISKEDMAQYEAIRELSDIKEHPQSTRQDIERAEQKLEEVNRSLKFVSEAGLLSRMNWWTAEYGLIGDVKSPRIFGAGLLSSLGESRECLKDKVKKIPLDVHCIDYSYDITEPQPQLFVTPDFLKLHSVLDDLAQSMAFKKGGVFGLTRAQEARTINTIELESGLQISGMLESFLADARGNVEFLKFSGPCQLSVEKHQLIGHGPDYHAQGYSTPLGSLEGLGKPLFEASETELERLRIKKGETVHLNYTSGFTVDGRVHDLIYQDGRLVLIALTDCRVAKGETVFFQPEWGTFDLATGSHVTSVFGGPADRSHLDETEDFVASRVPPRKLSEDQLKLNRFYSEIRTLRNSNSAQSKDWEKLTLSYLSEFSTHWLPGVELFEVGQKFSSPLQERLETHLLQGFSASQTECIKDGLDLARRQPLQ